VQRAVDPTRLEFLAQVYLRKRDGAAAVGAKYLTMLHKVSEIGAAGVERSSTGSCRRPR
jgi:hypothetical protein